MHTFVHTRVPACACAVWDTATLSLLRVGQDRGALFSPSPTHCRGRERGVIYAGHGANVDYANLHFCSFLFPGKRGKVKAVLNHCGLYLALQQSHGLIADLYRVTQVVSFWRKDGIKSR